MKVFQSLSKTKEKREAYEDQAHGYSLTRPLDCELVGEEVESLSDVPLHYPSHQSFGNASVVAVRAPPRMRVRDSPTTSSDAMPVVESWVPDPEPSNLLDSDSPGTTSTGEDHSSLSSTDLPISLSHPLGEEISRDNEITTPRPRLPLTAPPPLGGNPSFVVNLEFLGQDLPRQRYWVTPSMLVRRLYHLVATEIVGREDRHIRIYVDGSCLLHHGGTITDRHFPDSPLQMTVYLYRDCMAYARRVGESIGESTIFDAGLSLLPSPGIEMSSAEKSPVDDTSILITGAESAIQRRVSTRVPTNTSSQTAATIPRRPVRDRWYYAPEIAPPDVTCSRVL